MDDLDAQAEKLRLISDQIWKLLLPLNGHEARTVLHATFIELVAHVEGYPSHDQFKEALLMHLKPLLYEVWDESFNVIMKKPEENNE